MTTPITPYSGTTPQRGQSGSVFMAAMNALLAWIVTMVTEMNAAIVAMNLNATNSTSVTSLAIGTGSKSLTVEASKSYVVGMTVKIAYSSTNWMQGEVTSYNSGTGALVVNVGTIIGSGTFASWTISQAVAVSGGVVGTTTNDSAAAGMVGEFSSSTVLTGSAVSLTSGVTANVTSLSLTAGDWDVSGVVAFKPAASTSFLISTSGIATTSGLFGALGSFTQQPTPATVPAGDFYSNAPMTRISIAATTTVYLLGYANFSVSTCSAYGFLQARRVR